ncbi:ParB/RepB/Spo0J family partition protein [Caulobacter sp. RHG1]|uniref:ParB/RepB/Spo0J family partition protein n=1 Tax=Caulobacter sp. (strain RHG1) TaxID=2545762 RepID=UPI0015547328|nr:ParB/RepB/Spo0J family partition protein [Caulobacter sp. RHG1]NQE64365.1 putative plasmid stabilization protein [Caulobacter sp. RHG1]
MSKSKTPTLQLSRSRDIPFDKLVLSQSNVRRTKAGVSIEELAEDIARRTLLQSLSVRPVLDEAGAQTGMFEIPAGGRRYRALELLVRQKRLARNALVPCVIRTSGLAEEDSLAENTQRAPLHALDQFRAFRLMADKGQPEEEIAVAFNTTVAVVRQRLRLAAVAPALLDFYADDAMTLDQLMAFTVNPDHERQIAVWETIQKTYNREAYQIRRMLTDGAVRASDRRAQFVLTEYQDAGGPILRDLFEADQGGWLKDPGLVERLVLAKLERAAERVRAEGWKWVETAIDFPYGHTYGLRRLDGEPAPMDEAETATLAALKAEYEGLEEAHDGAADYPEAVDQRLGEIETAMDAIRARPTCYSGEELAIGGVFVSLAPDGQLRLERGFVLPEDEPPMVGEDPEPGKGDSVDDEAASDEAAPDDDPAAEREEDADPGRPLPDRLITEMTVHRTVALRQALAEAPDVAFLAALHVLALQVFSRGAYDSCLEISAKSVSFAIQPSNLAETPCAMALETRREAWAKRLPADPGRMWETVVALDPAERWALFALCVGLTVNATSEAWNRRPRALAHADDLAQALSLDMVAAGWAPTAETFLSRLTKAQIVQVVTEAKGAPSVEPLAGLKKDEMVATAAETMAGSNWLPKVLRTRAASPEGEAAALEGATAVGSETPSSDPDDRSAAPHVLAAE